MKECEKLSARTEEWNHIYPFMEWLQEQGLFLCRHETEEEAKGKGSDWPYPYPIAVGKNIEQLLYEYFDVNPNKLEQERRQLLAKLRKE